MVFAPDIRLWGRTSSNAEVTVNGVAIPVDELGIFATTITLRRGDNVVSVLSISPGGDFLERRLNITYIDNPG